MHTCTMRAFVIRLLTFVALTVSSVAWAGTFVTAAAPDASAPVLTTAPSAQSVTGSSAVISWVSDKVADSRVYFGTTLPLVNVAGEIEYATAHAVKLTKLLPNTSYSYQVVSVDPVGNKTTGAVQSFTTTTDTKTNQTIGAIGFAPATLAVGGTTTASATATSGLAVTFSTTATPTICSVSGSTVFALAAGTCTVAANQLGNSTYNAATQVTQNITVSKASQTIGGIAFTPATLAIGGTTTASATASSGLAVTFSSSATPTICSVSGSTVTGLLAGTCTITASQAGNASYLAATPVTQNITVSMASQTIGGIAFTPATLAIGGTTTASATASSGLAVTFSSSVTPSICSVTGSTVTGLLAGTCTITASQTGNANYLAATPVTQNITVVIAVPQVTFSPTSLTFTDQNIGTTSTAKAVTLTNTGNAPLLISLFDRTGDFAFASNTCGASLAASASCNLGITFSPTATAGRIGVARVTSNASGSQHSVLLSGTGVPSNAPICTLAANPARIQPKRSSTLTTNCSPAATSYTWTGGTCAGTTASTCTVTPAATTTYSVTGTNSFGNSTASVSVTVKAVDLTPILMLLMD